MCVSFCVWSLLPLLRLQPPTNFPNYEYVKSVINAFCATQTNARRPTDQGISSDDVCVSVCAAHVVRA